MMPSGPAALTARGGRILSEKGNHVKITIQLPERANITSIVIVPTNGCKKYREWNIETSADGKKWELLADLPDSKDEPYAGVTRGTRNSSRRLLNIFLMLPSIRHVPSSVPLLSRKESDTDVACHNTLLIAGTTIFVKHKAAAHSRSTILGVRACARELS